MAKDRVLVDSTALTDLFSGQDANSSDNILRDLVQKYDVNISDVSRTESAFSRSHTKDSAVQSILNRLHNQLDPNKDTETLSLRQSSINKQIDHTHPDYFPRRNAGERAIIEKWQPGDTIVSDDGFFHNQQANDRFTMRVREDMTPQLWAEMQASVMSTPQFLNMAAVENTISLNDHQAMAARFPGSDYLSIDEITHRQGLIANGIDPNEVHRMARNAEHHAARGVGAASVAVNVAEGNYGAAALDAVGMASGNSGVQKAATEVATKAIGAELLEAGVKKIPLVGAVVTAGTVLYASGAQAWDGNYKLAAGELAVGIPEALGNIAGFGVGDAARETARQGLIAAGGDEFSAVEKSGIRQLGEAGYALVTGKPVGEVLPPSHASMAQGADDMGERGQVSRIAVERAGTAQGHLVVLQDGSVQVGTVAFGNNPQIAAGKNGGTLGVLYAGTP